MNEEKFKVLKDIHDEIKQHPYRQSGDDKHLKSYRELLKELRSNFYDLAKPLLGDNSWVLSSFYHDFSSSSLSLTYGGRYKKGHERHIERCIMCVHKFLKTKEVNELWTYYTGVNTYDSKKKFPDGRSTQFLYDEEDDKFYPQYDEELLDAIIAEIEKVREERDKPDSEYMFSSYDKDTLEFYKKLKESGKYNLDHNE